MVVMGDLFFSMDLSPLVDLHREAGALATLALVRGQDPRRMGYARCCGKGQVRWFLEKPQRVLPGYLANAGIYVLEEAALEGWSPETPLDFGRKVLPELCRQGGVYGCLLRGGWRDTGEVAEYLAAQADALLLDGRSREETLLGEGSRVDKSAIVRAAVLGRDCRVGSRAWLEECVLWDGIQVGEGASLRGCAVADGCVLGKEVKVGAGAVLGERVVLEDGCFVQSGTRLPPGTRVSAGRMVGPGDFSR